MNITSIINYNTIPLFGELYLFINIVIVLFYFTFFFLSKVHNYYYSHKLLIYVTSILLLFSSLILINYPFYSQFIFNNIVNITEFSNFFKITTTFSSLFVLILSYKYISINKLNCFEQYIIILVAQLAMYILLCSNNIIIMYLSIELLSISIYILVAINRYNSFSIEAGLKYFILGAVSSSFLLFGFGLIYGSTGLLNLSELDIFFHFTNYQVYKADQLFTLVVIFLSINMIFIGLLFKIYAAPLHFWISDIYQGAPTHITAFISILPSINYLVIILKLILIFNTFASSYLYYLFLIVSLVSIILGSIGALYQKKIKRLLAYSSITYTGYFLLNISLAISDITTIFNFILFYLYYIVMLITFFSIYTIIQDRSNYYNYINIDQIKNLNGTFKTNSLLYAIFTLVLFSLAGIPPFLSFFGKLYLLHNLAIKSNIIIIILIILITVISTFYYLRVVKSIYYNKDKKWLYLDNIPTINAFSANLLILISALIYFIPSVINSYVLYLTISLIQ